MTATSREYSSSPAPELDESYWRALLREGEQAEEPSRLYGDIDEELAHAGAHPHPSPPLHAHSDWEMAQGIMDRDESLDLLVSGFNRGGLLVEWRSLRGFVPASQLVDFPNIANPVQRQRILATRVGGMLRLRVIELSEAQNRLILSERAAQTAPGERADLLSRIRPGDTLQGIVTNLCDFGAFVDLGGLEGLIHISELSWGRVGHPSEILSRGETVQVHVLEIHADAGRVALSVKRLHPDPWATVHLRYAVGEMVTGVITNVVDFGAFARIEEGLEGLIHVSELAEGHFLHPRNVVAEGQEITARILSIDGRARRLGLTLRDDRDAQDAPAPGEA